MAANRKLKKILEEFGPSTLSPEIDADMKKYMENHCY